MIRTGEFSRCSNGPNDPNGRNRANGRNWWDTIVSIGWHGNIDAESHTTNNATENAIN